MSALKLVNNTGYEAEKNLCFVNASIQLLHSIPDVKDFFKEKVYRLNYKERLPVCDEISRIFKTEGNFRTSTVLKTAIRISGMGTWSSWRNFVKIHVKVLGSRS